MPVPGLIGRQRSDAIYRLAYLLLVSWWLLPILFTIGIIAGLLWMVIDVLWQAVTNDSGLMTGGMGVDEWLERLFYWPIDQVEWTIFGTGKFPWWP